MLTQSDIKKIKSLLKNFATKDDLKSFATKSDLKNFATKDDLKELAQQKDLLEVKTKLDQLTELSTEGIGDLLEWTQEIHNSIVVQKLPDRVKKLEQVIKSS